MLTYAYMYAQVLESSHVVTQAAIAEFLDKWRDTRQALLDPHMAHDLKVYACVCVCAHARSCSCQNAQAAGVGHRHLTSLSGACCIT